MVKAALERELAGLGRVAESTLAGAALVLAEMLDDAGTADTARTAAARELRETLGVLHILATAEQTDGMTEFEARARARDERRASG